MVDAGIKAFTGKSSIEEAWRQVIPDKTKKVAIKVNCQTTGIYTKAKVVEAVTDGLILRGVCPSNIVIPCKLALPLDLNCKYSGKELNT